MDHRYISQTPVLPFQLGGFYKGALDCDHFHKYYLALHDVRAVTITSRSDDPFRDLSNLGWQESVAIKICRSIDKLRSQPKRMKLSRATSRIVRLHDLCQVHQARARSFVEIQRAACLRTRLVVNDVHGQLMEITLGRSQIAAYETHSLRGKSQLEIIIYLLSACIVHELDG